MSMIDKIGRRFRGHSGGGRMTPLERAEYMRPMFYQMGKDCAISPEAVFSDPALVSMGHNVRFSGDCRLFGHDGSINMVNRMMGWKLDAVGAIKIGSNVFIGHGTKIQMGTEIGDNVIIGMGSIVCGKVPGNAVYAGNPLRKIRTMIEHLERIKLRHMGYPWGALVEMRDGEFDAELEPLLIEHRVAHFFREERAL